LVVGVWIGRDDNKSLGHVSGGTLPAEIWHNFMTSAVAIDRHAPPALPFRAPQPQPANDNRKSPLPADWSDSTKDLRDLGGALANLFGGN
jgi:penicillin-binding protein 1A